MIALDLRSTVWSRRSVAVLLLCGLSEAGWSQPAHANGGPANVVTLPSAADLAKASPLGAQASRAAIDSAKTLAKSNDLGAAEQALTKVSAFQANTPDWHVETTQKLVAVAHELSRDGATSPATITALANKSLQHLSQVETGSTDSRVKANAKAMAGFIQQRYVGDPAAALASYRAALALSPNDKSIKENLDRLEKSDAILRARLKQTTKR